MASMPEHSHELPSHLVEELLSEKKALYIWTSLGHQARRAGRAVGSGWDVLPWCLCHTWTCLAPQGLQLCRTLEHLHSKRHSPKYSLQKWLFFMSCLIMDLKRKKRTFLYYVLISQKGRKLWRLQASVAFSPRSCQLFPLADTPANSCINHVCCEQKGTSGFIMPAFGSTKTQRSSQNYKGSYLLLNFICLSGTMNA